MLSQTRSGKVGMMAEEGRNLKRVIDFEEGYNVQLHTCELSRSGGRAGGSSGGNPVLCMRAITKYCSTKKGLC